jgi:hypothetical protein
MDKSPLTISNKEYYKIETKLSVGPFDYTKPLRLYCDVNGVIQPGVRSEEELQERFPDAIEIDVLPHHSWEDPLHLDRGMFWWDKEVIDRLAALSRSPHVDLVWLTDWRVSAPYSLDSLLGIESIGFLDWQRKFTDYNQSFKRRAIIEEQEQSPSKFIWVDDRANLPYGTAPHPFSEEKDDYDWQFDDEGNEIGDNADAYEESIPASQFLNVITDNNRGLTMEELDTIEKWIENNLP